MATGLRGTFVVSCTQTETDGIANASPRSLVVGSLWNWRGQAICVDGPSDRLLLGASVGEVEIRRRAGRRLRRVLGDTLPPARIHGAPDELSGSDGAFVVTDGVGHYARQ